MASASSSSSLGVQQRLHSAAAGKAKAQDDPLQVLNANGDAEPLDEHEQESVIASLKEANDKSNYFFRMVMLVMLALLEILYVSPLPDYIRGTHPETHLTMFFEAVHVTGSHDDLLKIPTLPIYLGCMALQTLLLVGAGAEMADMMGLRKGKGAPFPHQPHLFGTAPNWLAPVLSDIRWHPSHVGIRPDSSEYRAPPVTATMPPRLLYLCFLTFCSLPLPLMTFGTGSFINAAWWGLTSLVLAIVCACEAMIAKVDKEARGLTGMKYGYKGA